MLQMDNRVLGIFRGRKVGNEKNHCIESPHTEFIEFTINAVRDLFIIRVLYMR